MIENISMMNKYSEL